MTDRRVPPEAVDGLRQLLLSGSPFVGPLIGVLAAQEPRLLHARFTAEVQQKMPAQLRAPVPAVLNGLFSLSRGREELGLSVEDFVRDVSTSSSVKATAKDQKQLQSVLPALLSIPALAITAKAFDVLTENPGNFHSARVVTDLRPVFSDVASKPAFALIVHSLRIRVGTAEETHDVYVALDEADIARLQEVLARAQAKATTLRRSFPALKLPVITEEIG